MKYFFILGKNPELSICEIAAVFNQAALNWPLPNVLLAEIRDFDPVQAIGRLGGTVKIGRIELELPAAKALTADILAGLLPAGGGKVAFGFSQYGPRAAAIEPLAMGLKRVLKGRGRSARWVTSRDKALSSVVVGQNGLADKGADFALLPLGNKLALGRTLAVQAWKDFSARDYGRPGRDDRSGMLPPKLARIMANLACPRPAAGTVLLDPFCGSGTVLTEALLLGMRRVIGFDISGTALKDTESNIVWTKERYGLAGFAFDLHEQDVRLAGQALPPASVDAVVTEPYLGPQRGAFDISGVKKELDALYSQGLAALAPLLKPRGRICMVWPVFCRGDHSSYLSPDHPGLALVNPWPNGIIAKSRPKLSPRGLPVYGRSGQRVWREIAVLEKK